MSVEIIGMITTQKRSGIHPTLPPVVDCDYVARFARAHEAAGFDRILVPRHSNGLDAGQVVAYASIITERVHFLLAHRPDFTAPVFAARRLATLENFTGGRLAVHIVSDDSDERTSEYLDVVRRTWTSEQPFDHGGAHYRYKMAYSEVKPLQKPHLPVYLGGASEASFRPILADTEAKARARAERILAEAGCGGPLQSEGTRHLLAAAERGEVVDGHLWTAIMSEARGRPNPTTLVGTPEQVAQALLEYVELGVGTLLIQGFDPLDDAIDYGRELIPRVRALVAERESARQPVAA